jgi:hypothetical protein
MPIFDRLIFDDLIFDADFRRHGFLVVRGQARDHRTVSGSSASLRVRGRREADLVARGAGSGSMGVSGLGSRLAIRGHPEE